MGVGGFLGQPFSPHGEEKKDTTASVIDWGFISSPAIEGEAIHLTGYVPTDTSGFTVGSFDLGQHSEEDIRRIMQSYQNNLGHTYPLAQDTRLYRKIKPYALKKDISDAEAKKVDFQREEIEYLTAAKRYEFEDKIAGKKGGVITDAERNKQWKKLDTKTKTVLASVGWQYGLDSFAFKKVFSARNDKVELANALDELGEEHGFSNRRTNEVDWLLSPTDKVFRTMTKNDNFLE
jgi:hypothetical protein|tara:strand:+ start:428 stop:1129 length:702 start_codon:yes stop_codon:yes gene_type:complete